MALSEQEIAARDEERITRFTERVIGRAERRFEGGKNHFMARSTMTSIAAFFMFSDYKPLHDAFIRANEGIVSMLAAHDAEGEVYAVREDLGNGYQDSTDFVRVARRGGVATNALRRPGQGVVVRAETPESREN